MSAYRRGTSWIVEFTTAQGRRVRKSTSARSKKEAEALEAELRVREDRARMGLEQTNRNPEKKTIETLVSWWGSGPARRQRNRDRALLSLRKHTASIGHIPIDQFTAAMATQWLDGLDVSAATSNNLRAYLMSCFTRARKAGLFVGENPLGSTDRRAVSAVVPTSLPPHLIPALIDAAPTKSWRLAFALAAYTGMRRGEIARLTWGDLDLERGVLTVRTSKTRRPRQVGIHPELADVLRAAKAENVELVAEAGWNAASVVVRRALKRAGIEELPEGACFKALRSTWASRLIDCGARADVVELMGWGPRSSSVMQRHYLSVSPAVLLAEVSKLCWPRKNSAQIRHIGGKGKDA